MKRGFFPQAATHSNVSCRFVPHFFFELGGENEDRAPVNLDTQEPQHRDMTVSFPRRRDWSAVGVPRFGYEQPVIPSQKTRSRKSRVNSACWEKLFGRGCRLWAPFLEALARSAAGGLFFTEFHGVVLARAGAAQHEGLVGFGTPLVKCASTGVCIQLIETGPS